MTDSRAEIRKELETLIQEGRMIHLVELAQGSPKALAQVLKLLAEPKAKDKATGAKNKSAKSGTGAQAATKERGSSQAADRKLLDAYDFAPAYQRWYSRALRVVE
jgi:fructoselysine-6-P-deglycase FrlB-like protein